MKNVKRKIKRRTKEKKISLLAVFLFITGFIYLCQHMGVIRLGYVLGKEKAAHKELSNLNRSLYFENASLRSPHNLSEIACGNLGLNVNPGVTVRKICVVSSSKKEKDKVVRRLNRLFGFDSNVLAKPSIKPDNK